MEAVVGSVGPSFAADAEGGPGPGTDCGDDVDVGVGWIAPMGGPPMEEVQQHWGCNDDLGFLTRRNKDARYFCVCRDHTLV